MMGLWIFKTINQPSLASPLFPSNLSAKSNSLRLISRMTVRLLGKTVSGSGVIIGRNENQYYVLTCAHVVNADVEKKGFNILTYDNRSKKVSNQNPVIFKNLDLAIISFDSNREYPIASLSRILMPEPNIKTYTAGYPNLIYQEGEWQLTNNMGIEAYFVNQGKTTLILSTPLLNGYQLGLSNEIHQGMSGGPVLNDKLELIGVIGRTKYAGNKDFYQLSDGTYPSDNLWEEMEDASWAIPIYSILKNLIQLQQES